MLDLGFPRIATQAQECLDKQVLERRDMEFFTLFLTVNYELTCVVTK